MQRDHVAKTTQDENKYKELADTCGKQMENNNKAVIMVKSQFEKEKKVRNQTYLEQNAKLAD